MTQFTKCKLPNELKRNSKKYDCLGGIFTTSQFAILNVVRVVGRHDTLTARQKIQKLRIA